MHCCRNVRLVLIACLWLPLWLISVAPSALADGIAIRTAELSVNDEGFDLDADYRIELNQTLEDALNKGVVLYFELEFELTRSRWYWFDEKIATLRNQYKLSYNALTRQYRVGSAGNFQNFAALDEALRALSRISERRVLDKSALEPDTSYTAGLRMQLDISELPKPIQIDALASRAWSLDSGWYRWTASL
ncbi:MAG: DUF4390 domain-containing protein [Burkholderiales bacterium]|nr:DUF4390 domain-containing protein [Burkholderiales bacterium]